MHGTSQITLMSWAAAPSHRPLLDDLAVELDPAEVGQVEIEPRQIGEAADALAAGPDLVFSVGTSSVFPYISQPVRAARADGVPTVEINPGRTEVSAVVDLRLRATAAATFAALARVLGL